MFFICCSIRPLLLFEEERSDADIWLKITRKCHLKINAFIPIRFRIKKLIQMAPNMGRVKFLNN